MADPDLLSELLQPLRLQGALFLHGEFHEPWCVAVPASEQVTPLLRPGAGRLAILHMVLEGRCWVRQDGEEAVQLLAGDAAVFTRGDPHLIGSGTQHAPVELRHVVTPRMPCLERLHYGGAGDASLLVCGWFAYEADPPAPLLAALPSMFRAALGERPCATWLRPSLQYALDQAAQAGAGAHAVTARVAESLFLEAVRCHLDGQSELDEAWLAGLRDPQVRHCMALMHDRPAAAWSVETLAREVNLSRSVLAERFTHAVGAPPMQYLKKLRLALASRMLGQQRVYLSQVAGAVGYGSEAAFIRAFKSAYGVTPGEWRQRQAAGTRKAG